MATGADQFEASMATAGEQFEAMATNMEFQGDVLQKILNKDTFM